MSIHHKSKKNHCKNPEAEELQVEQPIQEESCPSEEVVEGQEETTNMEDVSAAEDVQERLQAELAEEKDRYLRLFAEFDNFRKRTRKEKEELLLNGSERAVVKLLPIVDDFERALQNMERTQEVEAVKEGVALIYQKLMTTLADLGVFPIEAEGKQLDTDFHEAIAMVPAVDDSQKGCVVDCVQKGYTLNEKVIRHSKVVVGN